MYLRTQTKFQLMQSFSLSLYLKNLFNTTTEEYTIQNPLMASFQSNSTVPTTFLIRLMINVFFDKTSFSPRPLDLNKNSYKPDISHETFRNSLVSKTIYIPTISERHLPAQHFSVKLTQICPNKAQR